MAAFTRSRVAKTQLKVSRVVRTVGFTFRSVAICLGLIIVIGSSLAAMPASAQGMDWLGKLFGGGQPHVEPPARAPGYDRRGGVSYTRPHAPRQHAAEPSRAPREKDRPAPSNASMFVYVIGDGFGQNLASGLDEALADRHDVAIVHKAKAATGLAATEALDWPKAVDAMLAVAARPAGSVAEQAAIDPVKDASRDEAGKKGQAGGSGPDDTGKPSTEKAVSNPIDVAVIMIGSSDRQAIRLGGESLKPGTPEWTAEYRKRVMAIDDAFRRKGIPLIWVGVPITKDDGFADDMAAFNDIYREAAAKTGTVYVDTWEAFSDDNGEFRPVGPDINGQMTRLRMADGIYFTKAGSRKLAHFVEIHVRRALDGKMARPPVPEAPAPAPPVALAPKPDVGPISDLTEQPLSRGGRLATAYRAETPIRTSINGPQAVPAGRADDLRWPASASPSR